MNKHQNNLTAIWSATPFPSLLADWRHWLAFVAWLALMFAVQSICGKSAWGYVAMTVVGVALLAVTRPWQLYGSKVETGNLTPIPLRHCVIASRRHNPKLAFDIFFLAPVAGLAVFAIWVGPETDWVARNFPGLADFYRQWCGYPFGTLAKPVEPSVYAPEACGWTLALVRVAGSAFVIAVIEEFFWRGWLYRRLISREVQSVPLRQWNWEAFAIMVALFGIEHDRWLVGMAAGAVYGWLMLRSSSLWPPIVAHAVTNLVLGLYVLGAGRYGFW